MIAAYGGFPTRYPHWRFGMEYEQLSKGYSSTGCRRSTSS
jgi:stage V sporulation protein R